MIEKGRNGGLSLLFSRKWIATYIALPTALLFFHSAQAEELDQLEPRSNIQHHSYLTTATYKSLKLQL